MQRQFSQPEPFLTLIFLEVLSHAPQDQPALYKLGVGNLQYGRGTHVSHSITKYVTKPDPHYS